MIPVLKQTPDDLHAIVTNLYKIAHAITGFRGDADKAQKIDIPATTKLLQEFHPRRDQEDLENAVKWGALGKYGDFTGINARTIINWVDAYTKSPEFKQKLRDKKQKPKELPPPNMDYNQVWQDAIKEVQDGKTPRGLASFILNAGRALNKFDWNDKIFVEECKYRARVKMVERIKNMPIQADRLDLKNKLKDEKSEAFRTECRRQATLIKLEEDASTT